MQDSTVAPVSNAAKRDWLYRVHKFSGLVAVPFLLISIVLALSLTHTQWLTALSELIYPSLLIPQVKLDEPMQPGSWDQALKVARLATGKEGRVITTRDENTVVVQAFEEHTHDPEVAKTNKHVQLLIDTRTMNIVRVQDNSCSLVSKAHGIHAVRFFGISGFSIANVSSIALLVLLVTGGMLVWRDRKAGKQYERPSLWHVREGQIIGVFIIVIVLTTLDFEFGFLGGNDKTASHLIPSVQLGEPIRPGSLDQARHLVEQAIGAAPHAVFIRDGGNDVKFSEAGDGIGGKSVWMNANTMTIERITDWRNDRQTLGFILHDGRWLGGMNALNVNDAVALVLLVMVLGGAGISWRNYRSRKAATK